MDFWHTRLLVLLTPSSVVIHRSIGERNTRRVQFDIVCDLIALDWYRGSVGRGRVCVGSYIH